MSRGRIAALVAGALTLVLLVLAIDLSPAVPPRAAPTGEEVRAGRDALRRLRAATRSAPPSATVAFSAADIEGIAALAANASRVQRVQAGIDGATLSGAASLRLPLGLWLNLRVATAAPAGTGFPPLDASVGDLGLPRWLARAGLGLARRVAVWRGGRLPPLDVLVQRHAVDARGLALTVAAPLDGSGLVRQLVASQAAAVDPARTAAIYCALVRTDLVRPAASLDVQLGRALDGAAGDADGHRAALVALAMFTVSPRAGDLAGDAADRAARCGRPAGAVRLGGRADLAKHWALSAALGATLGGDITTAMGEWKELSDSLPGGSGFSFVDLAADRAGLRIGRALTRPERAAAVRTALMSGAALLPLDATLLGEGVTNADFVARYGSIDGADYARAVRQIDALLDREPLLRAAR